MNVDRAIVIQPMIRILIAPGYSRFLSVSETLLDKSFASVLDERWGELHQKRQDLAIIPGYAERFNNGCPDYTFDKLSCQIYLTSQHQARL